MNSSSDDPVLARRQLIAKGASLAKRLGYLAVGVSIVAFTIGLLTSFTGAVSAVVIWSLIASAVLLIPAVIFGYGVSMAESEERGEPFRH